MNLAAWLRLTLIPGIGGETQRKLLGALGSPQTVFEASRSDLCKVIGEKSTQILLDTSYERAVESALSWAEQPGCHILTLADNRYPQALLQIPDPPTLLYVRGHPELLNTPALAIVGSRNATPQGAQTARSFARTLTQSGLTIVSGLALGIDAAAHQGALETHNPLAKTLAVIGTGANRIYPASNKELAQAIVERGAILSEFPLDTPAHASNFPRRNRLISGLSLGVLVVEAALQSGSLITARLAGEQGREVFAIPGSIHSPFSRGCHHLIRQGAKLVETTADILDEIGWQSCDNQPFSVLGDKDPILKAMGHDPCTLDDLLVRTGQSADQLLSRLLELELCGEIGSLAGNRYQRLCSHP